MSPEPSRTLPLVVGIPVYAGRILPRFGIAREFLLGEVEREVPRVDGVRIELWDPSDRRGVGAWLRSFGVQGVICGGIHPRFRVALEAEGLWVLWGYRGPADEVLRLWASGELTVQERENCPRRRHRRSAPERGSREGRTRWREE
jgi:predicted Fe-Mo cluster-binding NifX family protein